MPRTLRTYRWLMRALPRSFSSRFGSDMLDMVRDRARQSARPGPGFWAGEYVDLLRTALRERVAEARRPRVPKRGEGSPLGSGDGWGVGMGGDLKVALRNVLRARGFSVVVVLTLALGIGVNAAVFSIVDTVVLRPLPFDDSDELVGILTLDTQSGQAAVYGSYADFIDIRRSAASFEGVEGYRTGTWVLSGDDRVPRNLDLALVTNGFFSLLGVQPLMGRTFAEDEHTGDAQVVVLSHSFWLSEFGGDPDVLGRRITLSARPMTVIGVMPEGLDYPYFREMSGWVPLEHGEFEGADGTNAFTERDWVRLAMFGRLADGATIESAGDEVEAIAAGLAEAYPRSNANLSAVLRTLKEIEVGTYREPFLLLLAAVVAILLIATVNTASLLLARGTARASEVAVRTALGAGRARLARLFMAEALVYAALGAVLGLALAHGVLAVVQQIGFNAPLLDRVSLDGRVLGIMSAVTLGAGLLFGVAPAFQGSRSDVQTTLKDGGARAGSGAGRNRVQKMFVATEMALSTVLVAGAGLLVASFANIVAEDPGFDPEGVMSVRISLPITYMSDPDDNWRGSSAFFEELEDNVAALPGIESVALSYTNPLEPTTTFRTRFFVPGFLEPDRANQPFTNLGTVTPTFFETFEIPLLEGRIFDDRDTKESPGVVIINETMARRYFGDENPIGHQLGGPNYWSPMGYPYPWEIIGVVGDVKSAGLTNDPAPAMYLPFTQGPMGNMRLIARSQLEAGVMARQLRQTVWDMDPAIPMEELHTMEEFIAQSVSTPRLAMWAVASFAALALLLASIGVYGVLSYTVGLRQGEFGIRQALGANRNDVLGLVLRQGLVVAGGGVVLGLAIALYAGRYLDRLLYGVTPTDPGTLAVVSLVLLTVAVSACLIPALRATRVDPVGALRSE